MKYSFKYSLYLISFFLAFSIAIPQSNCLAQNQLRIYDDIGGGGSSSQGSSSTDNTFIYVAGGLLVAGVLAYALFLKKDNKEETDTTSVSVAVDLFNERSISEESYSKVLKAKEKLPVDIFFGIRNDQAILRGKTYLLGVSVKL